MNSVVFKPWKGDNYSTGGIFLKKILILGEAHRCSDPKDCDGCNPGTDAECREMTKDIIRKQFTEPFEKWAIYTKFARLILGRYDITTEDKSVFWNSVAFYNYVQQSPSSEARVTPTDEMWRISERPFHEVMEELKPDLLIICGDELWNNMPGKAGVDWPEGETLQSDGITEKTWYYTGKTKRALSLVIYHPSGRGFSYDYSTIVKKAIELA
jgi:hypothetical protein